VVGRLGGHDGEWQASASLATVPPVQQLRVNTAGLQTVATRWGASVDELSETASPAGLGLSCQASTAAVNAAHADIAAFTAALAARVSTRTTHVAEAGAGYIANETSSANQLAAVANPVIGV